MGEVITVKYKATVEKILNILKEDAPKKAPSAFAPKYRIVECKTLDDGKGYIKINCQAYDFMFYIKPEGEYSVVDVDWHFEKPPLTITSFGVEKTFSKKGINDLLSIISSKLDSKEVSSETKQVQQTYQKAFKKETHNWKIIALAVGIPCGVIFLISIIVAILFL